MKNVTLHHGTKKSIIAKATEAAGVKTLLGGENAKTLKGEKYGILTQILYLLPDDKLCPMARLAGCREGCLVTSGLASVYDSVNAARKRRSALFHDAPDVFFSLLFKELDAFVKRAAKMDMKPAIRLNGTSDIDWSKWTIDGKTVFDHYPSIQFYDYTKSPSIVKASASVSNWHMTASYSGASEKYSDLIVKAAEQHKVNLAVVFPRKAIPTQFLGRDVIDGDDSDLRFKDETGKVVALYAKGDAINDTSGFVIRLEDLAEA